MSPNSVHLCQVHFMNIYKLKNNFVCLSSIGGDLTIENVTTLPSKSRCGFPCELCAASPAGGALGSQHFISGPFFLFFPFVLRHPQEVQS